MNTRRLLQSAVAVSALLAASIASADGGSITLSTGEVVSGDIQQIVKGEYVVIQLPTGEVKAIAWTQIGQVAVGGSITIGGGTPPPAAPKPTPQPTYTPPPPVYTQPGPTVYSPPPPPPTYMAPQYMPPPRPAFQPAFNLGVRFGSINPGGTLAKEASTSSDVEMSQYVKSGWSIEGDVGLHFSPSWTFYGFWEHGQLGRANTEVQPSNPVTNAVGIGMNANTSPNAPFGFVFDIALGYRWLTSPILVGGVDSAGNPVTSRADATFSGVMPLRVGLGIAIAPTRKMRIDVMGQFSVGSFTQQTDNGSCSGGCEIADQYQGTHTFTGLTVGGRWDL